MSDWRTSIFGVRLKQLETVFLLLVLLCLSGCRDSIDSVPQTPAVEVAETHNGPIVKFAEAETSLLPSPAPAPVLQPPIYLVKFHKYKPDTQVLQFHKYKPEAQASGYFRGFPDSSLALRACIASGLY